MTVTPAVAGPHRLRDRFGRCTIASPLTVAVKVDQSLSAVSAKAIADLGRTNIRLTHPPFADDTLISETKVPDRRESRSRPPAGIVSVKPCGFNQNGVLICEFERKVLMDGRSHDLEYLANNRTAQAANCSKDP